MPTNKLATAVSTAVVSHHTDDELVAMMTKLHMSGMKREYQSAMSNPEFANLSFNDQLFEILKAEVEKREQSSYERRRRKAQLLSDANTAVIIERLDDYKLTRNRLDRMMSLRWMNDDHIILITGATGVGKTDLGSAICDSALRAHKKVSCEPYDLFIMSLCDFYLHGKRDEYQEVLSKYLNYDVLMLDDVCTGISRDCEALVFKDLLEKTKERHIGLILTSQSPLPDWHTHLGGDLNADAVLDRIKGRAEVTELTGDSKRMLKEISDER